MPNAPGEVLDRLKIGSTPISEDRPTGVSARYEPEFEKLQAEMTKLESTTSRDVAWSEVITLSQMLLTTKTKDLLAASYLTLGLYQTEGFGGLAIGLVIVSDMIAHFWPSLFPEQQRMRARAAALAWLSERVSVAVLDRQPTESDRAALAACCRTIDELATLLTTKAPDTTFNLTDLQRVLRDKLQSIPDPAVPAAAEPEATTTVAEQRTHSPEASEAVIDSVDTALAAVAHAWQVLPRAAACIRQLNPVDPRAYRLLRASLWGRIETLPPLDGVDAAFLLETEQQITRRDYLSALERVEQRFPEAPLWIDLQRLAAQSLEGLGFAYDPARRTVTEDTLAFVRRFPELFTLNANSVAAMDEKTRFWLRSARGADEPANDHPEDKLTETMNQARRLASKGRFLEATALLQKEIQGLPHRRDRFLWRLALANLCLEAGRPNLALPQLESLDAEAQKFSLEDWEPPLAIEVVKLLWQCHGGAQSEPSEKASQMYARLCRLDLAAALALDGRSRH